MELSKLLPDQSEINTLDPTEQQFIPQLSHTSCRPRNNNNNNIVNKSNNNTNNNSKSIESKPVLSE